MQQTLGKIVAACVHRTRYFPWRENSEKISEYAAVLDLLRYLCQVAPRETSQFTCVAIAAMVADIDSNMDLLALENSAALIAALQDALPRCASGNASASAAIPSEFRELSCVTYGVMERWPLLAARIVDLQVRFAVDNPPLQSSALTSRTLPGPHSSCALPPASSR